MLTKGFFEVCAVPSAGRRNALPHQYSAESQLELHYFRVVVQSSSSYCLEKTFRSVHIFVGLCLGEKISADVEE